MKYKIVGFFFVTALIICFYSIKSEATTFNSLLNNSSVNNMLYTHKSGTNRYIIIVKESSSYSFTITGSDLLNVYISPSYSGITADTYYADGFDPLAYPDNQFTVESTESLPFNGFDLIVRVKGSVSDESDSSLYFDSVQDYEDYLNPPDPPEPLTWYEELWNDFTGFVNILEESLGEYFGIEPLMDFFDDLWTVKVGEGEDQLTKFPLATPTPIPATPTPIPYQTILTPDGNGGYSINYYYTNPSGTPIITNSPPISSNTIVDNDFEYPYYENPDNVDNPYEFKIPWYLKLILKNNNVDVDQLDDEYQIAEQTIQSDDVLNAVDNIYDGFQVIPSGWLMILGAIAALPLFAALIHRMLNG